VTAGTQEVSVLRCGDCARANVPPACVCRACGGSDLQPEAVPGTGKIYTYTVIRVPPAALAAEAPYVVAVIDLDDGVRLTTRLQADHIGQVAVGARATLLRTDDRGYWFRLLDTKTGEGGTPR
jgi:uncharacterized OB-fold protein